MDYHFGLDIGRSDVKCQFGPGEKDVLIFPSYVSKYRERDLKQDGFSLNNLEVAINGSRYFVGELAREMNGVREFGSNKIEHENTIILLLIAIAASPITPEYGTIFPRVCAGLPINNYTRQAEKFEVMLNGVYEVTLPGKHVWINLSKERSLCFQECIGTYMDMALNENGKATENALFKGCIGIIDIGYKTVNFFKMIDGRFIDSGSGTLERMGLSDAFLSFYKRISREKGYTPNEAELKFEALGNSDRKNLAEQIEGALTRWWSDPSEFNQIYFTGGGGIALEPFFSKYQGLVVPNARVSNARGFRKVAVAKLG